MSAGYTNLRTVSYRDTIAELIARANQTHTRATGVQVFSSGDGMAYEDTEGFINPINPALFDDAKSQIAEASEALVATEADLEAAQGRIDETTVLLGQLDEQATASEKEMEAVAERLAQNERDLETARIELDQADQAAAQTMADLDGKLTQNATALDGLSSELGRVDIAAQEATDKANTASQKITATEGRLDTTQSALEALVPRVGSVETAVRDSDAKMTELSSEAAEASSAAQNAMSAAQAAEARVQALANAQGSLIIAGGFETATTENAYYRYETSSARTGKFVGRFMAAEGSPEVRWPEVRASKSQTLEMRFYATRFGQTGGAYPYGCLFYRDKNDQQVSLFPNSTSITPTVSSSWQEYVWRFDPLPADARSVIFRSGIRGGSASDTGYIMLDDVTAHDTASYQEALDAALAAKQAADDAAENALNAMTRANAAYDSASGKTAVRNATTAPQGVGTTPGDTWIRWSAFPGGVVTGQWSWDGTTWQVQQFSHQVQASVDLGKATVGQLHGSYVTAGSLGADRIAVGVGENALADPYFQDVVFSAERAATSLGAWTRKSSGSSITYTTASTADTVTFRYGGTSMNRVIPTTGGRNWHVSAIVDSGGGGARINVRWYNSLGASTYVIAAATTTGTGKRTISADWTAPEDATGFLFDIHFPGSSTARSCIIYGGAAARAKTGSVLIEDGAVKAKQVDAESVAGAVGQFVKVQAENVEVTGELAARVGTFMDAATRNLIVTGSATLAGDTWAKNLAAQTVAAAKIGVGQLTAGSASMDTATANKLFADIFAANKITAAQIVVGGLPSAALADGVVSAVKIADGAVTAGKVTATEELSAKILRATSAEVATQFVTDRLVIGTGDNAGVLEVLGKAITNDLNVRGTLRGRDAILAGTLDVKQLNVTEDMAAQIVSAMTVNTKKLVVTEAAVMQHVTAIEGIITPKITASEARIGDLLASKASIADIQGGNLTVTGHFRSGAEGKPGVIIPQNYTTQAGMEQLGVWLAPDGKAPSLGSEWGRTAGMWLDNASNVAGSTNSSPLFIRGQAGAGVRLVGGLAVGDSNGNAIITPIGGGNATIIARLGDADLRAGRYATLVGGSTANVITPGDLYLKGGKSIRLTDPADNPYSNSWTGGGLKTVYMGGSSGIVYTETSTARAKVDIETAEPDHEWLDMRTVTYRDRIAVELQAEIEARRAAGDCTPLTAEEHERLAISDRRVPGRIAEEGVGVADAQVVLDGSGQVEGWDYSRDAVMLTPHVREHRDKIADQDDRIADQDDRITNLESRIAELESALL